MYDSSNGSSSYYIVKQTFNNVNRYMYHPGRVPIPWADKPGDGLALSQQPEWGFKEKAFRFDTYTAACHWLARWTPLGKHQLIHVSETDNGKVERYVPDGPVDPNRIDERDWREFHHMNGKYN